MRKLAYNCGRGCPHPTSCKGCGCRGSAQGSISPEKRLGEVGVGRVVGKEGVKVPEVRCAGHRTCRV